VRRLERWLFALLGKDPDAVVLTFASGASALISPYFGRLIDLHGYAPLTPLAVCALLWTTRAVR
jgi:hypothetical protein